MTDVQIVMRYYGCDEAQAKSRIERGVSTRVIQAYRDGQKSR